MTKRTVITHEYKHKEHHWAVDAAVAERAARQILKVMHLVDVASAAAAGESFVGLQRILEEAGELACEAHGALAKLDGSPWSPELTLGVMRRLEARGIDFDATWELVEGARKVYAGDDPSIITSLCLAARSAPAPVFQLRVVRP